MSNPSPHSAKRSAESALRRSTSASRVELISTSKSRARLRPCTNSGSSGLQSSPATLFSHSVGIWSSALMTCRFLAAIHAALAPSIRAPLSYPWNGIRSDDKHYKRHAQRGTMRQLRQLHPFSPSIPILLPLVLVVGALVASAFRNGADDFIPLFEGNDLGGWVEMGEPGAFSISEGVLSLEHPTNYPNWLR